MRDVSLLDSNLACSEIKMARADECVNIRDWYGAVYLITFYQGISNLFPWNVLITANNYFADRLSGLSGAEHFITYFAVIFMTMKFVFLIGGASTTSIVSSKSQIHWSILGNSIVFLLIAILCVQSALSTQLYYYLLLFLVLLASLFSSFVEAGYFALLSTFPSAYTQAYLAGHGFAGVLVVLLNIASILGTLGKSSLVFPQVYFGISFVVIATSWLLFHALFKLDFFTHFYLQSSQHDRPQSPPLMEGENPEKNSSLRELLPAIYDLAGCLFLLAWLNLLIFPTLIFMTASTQAGGAEETLFHKHFFHSIALLIINVSDLIGKILPIAPAFALSKLPFFFLACLRLLFLPAFLLGNLKLERRHLPLPSLFASDGIFFSLVGLKAFTGGYLGTLCLMLAPTRVKAIDCRRATTLIIYSLATGVLCGAVSSLALKYILIAISTPA